MAPQQVQNIDRLRHKALSLYVNCFFIELQYIFTVVEDGNSRFGTTSIMVAVPSKAEAFDEKRATAQE